MIQYTMRMHQLLLLPHLLAKQIRGEEPLMDYLQFHVMNNVEYLAVIRKKAMEKVGVEAFKETCCKEKEANKVREFATYFITNEHAS